VHTLGPSKQLAWPLNSALEPHKSMERTEIKSWEIWLKEIICLPYYLILAIGISILADNNILITLGSLAIGWYLIAYIFWHLYKSFVLTQSNKGHIKLYSYLFTLQTLLCSVIIYIAEF